MSAGIYELVTVNQKLALKLNPFTPFTLDFGDYLKNSNLGEGGRRLLYKAIKLKDQTNNTILDATGGWARDAFFMAQHGFQVTVIEQAQPVFALLNDAYQRALTNPDLIQIMARIKFIYADACTLLREGLRCEIIYLDPMFPERKKSAKVKKDLQILQELPETFLGSAEALFLLARKAAIKRVIVKRPIAAPFLADAVPDFQYKSKTVRFDVYTALF
jgi:16S rRNA (guanine1516-N2)-methyltransferase